MVTQSLEVRPLQLTSNHFAELDPQSGKWKIHHQNYSTAKNERALQAMRVVLQRLAVIDREVPQVRLLMTNSPDSQEKRCVEVIDTFRLEIREHKRFVGAIQDKVEKYIERKWQWYTNLFVIGFLFRCIVNSIQCAVRATFNEMLKAIEKKYVHVQELRRLVEIASLIRALPEQDRAIARALHQSDRKNFAMTNQEVETILKSAKPLGTGNQKQFIFHHNPEKLDQVIVSRISTAGDSVEHCYFTCSRMGEDSLRFTGDDGTILNGIEEFVEYLESQSSPPI